MADVTNEALYVLAGSLVLPKLIDMVAGFFKGSVTRNIETADKQLKDVETKLDEVEKKLDVVRAELEDKLVDLDRKFDRLDMAHGNHKEAMSNTLGQIEGRLTAIDNRVAKQGEAYEEKIEQGFRKLEIELNRKLAQFIAESPTTARNRRR